MADHHFSVEIAVEYGVNAAILFQNIHFWCEKNRANGMNCHDGMYWTYNSRKAFRELFPYMSEKQIKAALDKLIENGLITTGTYNEDARDRTLWYAVTKKGDCIFQNGNMEMPETANANAENGSPLPYIKQTDINTDRYKEAEEESAGACEEVNPYGEGVTRLSTDTVQAYAANQLMVMSPRAMEELNGFVDDLTEDIVRHAIDNALDQGVRKWAYVKSILNDYVAGGVRNVADAAACDERHRKKRKGSCGSGPGFDRSTSEGYVPLGANDRMI